MKQEPTQVNAWSQQTLFPEEFARITCEVVVDARHDQYTFHVRSLDATDVTLTSAWSCPLRPLETFQQDFHRCMTEFIERVNAHVYPF